MRFVSIDVETANPRMSSICQIGVVTFDRGQEVSAEVHLVNPHEYFDPFNVAVTGSLRTTCGASRASVSCFLG